MWAKGRVILCGDAAHVFPPCKSSIACAILMLIQAVGGQGIASGFRDAISLSWRLAMLCRYQPTDNNHHQILKAWYEERKQQLALSLATTVANGRMVCETDPLKIFLRDWYIWLIQLIPSWRKQLQRGHRKDALLRYKHSNGMPFIPDLNGGLYLPQVYCRTTTGEILFTDDTIYSPNSKSLFRLFVYLQDSSDLSSIQNTLQDIETWSRGEFNRTTIPIIVENTTTTEPPNEPNIFQIATAEEFSNSPLCNNRPKPLDYDPFLLRNQVQGRYVIVRMDRIIFASCMDEKELQKATQSMLDYLHADVVSTSKL